MPSNAELLFQRLSVCATPEEVLKQIEASPENEFCECKSGKTPDREVKKYWSEALSGFANTSGGVLIWGINVPSDRDGLRRTTSIDLCEKPEDLERQLKARILEAVEPALSKIEYKIIRGQSGGLVLVYVPEGTAKPHCGQNQYFMRVDDKFKNIPTSFLRTLFFPEQRTNLVIEISIKKNLTYSASSAGFVGGLSNRGNASAMEVFCSASATLPTGWGFNGGLWQPAEGYTAPSASLIRPLHPGANVPLGFIPLGSANDHGELRDKEYLKRTEFEFYVFCLNQAGLRGKIVFEKEDIRIGSRRSVVMEPLIRDESKT